MMIWQLVVCLWCSVGVLARDVEVDTAYGKLVGFTYTIPIPSTFFGLSRFFSTNKEANVFLGVPFAEPPVGELRFEKPETPTPWQGERQAKKFAPSCTPHDRSAVVEPHSEDCLYLNVIAPSEESTDAPGYPVMVWIHGGGYCVGTAVNYGYEHIANNFITRGVIVVTIQYRLGPYGFLSNGDSVLPGNLGYWDQRAALRFVRENIANFGGDPNRITLFGLSAGGASVNALSLSPYTRDLFANGIEMSGSSLAPWASGEKVVEVSQALAKRLGCPIEESEQMKECLKLVPVENFFSAIQGTLDARRAFDIVTFTPRIDGDFFPRDFEGLIEDSPKKPTIIGIVDEEAAFFTTEGSLPSINKLAIRREDFEQFGESDLLEFITYVAAPDEKFGAQAGEVRERLIEHYVRRNAPAKKDYKFYIQRYTQLLSDVLFKIPCLRMKNLKMADDWPVWFYFNDHYNRASFEFDDPVKGATHLQEYPYLFGISPFHKFEFDSDEEQLQKALLETFTNFAKFGTPSTTEYPWKEVSMDRPLRHLHFGVRTAMRESFMEEEVAFWDSMQAYDFDIIRNAYRKRIHARDEL